MEKGKGDIRGGDWICVKIHGKIGGRLRCGLYILLSLPLARESVLAIDREEENARTSTLLSRALAIVYFCANTWCFFLLSSPSIRRSV